MYHKLYLRLCNIVVASLQVALNVLVRHKMYLVFWKMYLMYLER